jgi:uncharacterized protein (TIGR03067 family)
MNRFAVAGGLLVFALGGVLSTAHARSCARAADAPVPKELHGTYTVVAISKGGEAAPEDFRKEMSLTITKDELTFTIKDKKFPAKITKVDPKARPATIDIAPTDGPEKGKTFLGIYTYKDGELSLSFTEKGERPKDFSGDNDAVVMRLRKVEKKDQECHGSNRGGRRSD